MDPKLFVLDPVLFLSSGSGSTQILDPTPQQGPVGLGPYNPPPCRRYFSPSHVCQNLFLTQCRLYFCPFDIYFTLWTSVSLFLRTLLLFSPHFPPFYHRPSSYIPLKMTSADIPPAGGGGVLFKCITSQPCILWKVCNTSYVDDVFDVHDGLDDVIALTSQWCPWEPWWPWFPWCPWRTL